MSELELNQIRQSLPYDVKVGAVRNNWWWTMASRCLLMTWPTIMMTLGSWTRSFKQKLRNKGKIEQEKKKQRRQMSSTNSQRNSRMKKKSRASEKAIKIRSNNNNWYMKNAPKRIKSSSKKVDRHLLNGEAKETLAWDMLRPAGSSSRWLYKRRAMRIARWKSTEMMEWVLFNQSWNNMKKDHSRSQPVKRDQETTSQTSTNISLIWWFRKTRWLSRILRTLASNINSSMQNHPSNKLWIPTSTCLRKSSRNQ